MLCILYMAKVLYAPKKFILAESVVSLSIGLSIVYAFLLLSNSSKIGLFTGDESLYYGSVFSLMDGNVDGINHPLLAKTMWYVIVSMYYIVTGSDSFVIWRFGNVLFSIGTLLYFYTSARLFFSPFTSFIAVLLLALDPMFFSFSHIMQPDIPMVFFFVGSLYYFLRFIKEKESKSFYLSGLFLGFSLATKMSPLFVLPFISIAICLLYKRRKVLWYYPFFPIAGFTLGNILFFVKSSGFNFFQYVYALFSSQLQSPLSPVGHLLSPSWSWFTIPQILTLYRIVEEGNVETIVAFQNPLFFVTTLPILLFSFYRIIAKKIREKDVKNNITIIIVYITAIYLPLFFNLHATYYYYILPLIPLSILLFLHAIMQIRMGRYILNVVLILSTVIFVLYYPLLVGKEVPKSYEMTLFSYSRYHFPEVNKLFCQACSPRR